MLEAWLRLRNAKEKCVFCKKSSETAKNRQSPASSDATEGVLEIQ
jgi:hypothetical protein